MHLVIINASPRVETKSNTERIPLYVENVPGIMLEFLETLRPKKEAYEKMGRSFAEKETFYKEDILVLPVRAPIFMNDNPAGMWQYIRCIHACLTTFSDLW